MGTMETVSVVAVINTSSASLALSFGTSQVHQVQLPDTNRGLGAIRLVLRALAHNGEDRVGPAAAGVHESRAHRTVLFPTLHHLVDLNRALHHKGSEVFDIDARVQIFLELQLALRVFAK